MIKTTKAKFCANSYIEYRREFAEKFSSRGSFWTYYSCETRWNMIIRVILSYSVCRIFGSLNYCDIGRCYKKINRFTGMYWILLDLLIHLTSVVRIATRMGVKLFCGDGQPREGHLHSRPPVISAYNSRQRRVQPFEVPMELHGITAGTQLVLYL